MERCKPFLAQTIGARGDDHSCHVLRFECLLKEREHPLDRSIRLRSCLKISQVRHWLSRREFAGEEAFASLELRPHLPALVLEVRHKAPSVAKSATAATQSAIAHGTAAPRIYGELLHFLRKVLLQEVGIGSERKSGKIGHFGRGFLKTTNYKRSDATFIVQKIGRFTQKPYFCNEYKSNP